MATHFDVQDVENIIAYQFRDKALLRLALRAPHRNSLGEEGQPTDEGNRRLSTLGDAVLKLIIAEDWYPTEESQAFLTNTYVMRFSNHALCNIAFRTGISNCIRMTVRQAGADVPPATLCGAVKAIIGAAWLDSGKNETIVRRIASHLEIVDELEPRRNGSSN